MFPSLAARSLLGALCLVAVLACPSRAQDCSSTSVGLLPLNDLGPGLYQGFPGGLFPGGLNHAPAAHDSAGLAAAANVLPRAPDGTPNANGAIVLLSIGLSNTTQEWQQFMTQVAGDPSVNPSIVVVDGAKGGVPASQAANPNDPYWDFVLARLSDAGVTPQQVQAVWLKTAEKTPTQAFPSDAQILRDDMRSMVQNVKALLPNTELLYLSSRIYAGYAVSTLNPEPHAYQSGFAVKWLIEDQIMGAPGLNFDSGAGPVLAPWISWGPYLWADGLDARSDLLSWECGDYQSDGTHPGTSARIKVADRLESFFATDASSRSWWLASPTPACPDQGSAEGYGPALASTGGAPRLVASAEPRVPTVEELRLHAWNAPPSALGGMLVGLASFAPGAMPFKGGSLLVDPLLVLIDTTNANGKAWLSLGAVPFDPALCGGALFAQYAVTDAGAPHGVALSRGLRLLFGH